MEASPSSQWLEQCPEWSKEGLLQLPSREGIWAETQSDRIIALYNTMQFELFFFHFAAKQFGFRFLCRFQTRTRSERSA